LNFHIPEAYSAWITLSNLFSVLVLVVAQSMGQRSWSRRRQGDCGSPESEPDRDEHQVRSQNSKFQISHIPETYPPWITHSNLLFWHWFMVFRSLNRNELGPEGCKAIAEALKVNTSVQNIR
jgi:hypothetical protein